MEDIKNSVRQHLQNVGESNVKQIAKATGHSDTEVINALNALRVYAEVECAQGGRGKGMTYWITKAESTDFGTVPAVTKSLREKNAELSAEVKDYEHVVSVIRSSLGIKDGDSIRLAIDKLKSDLRDARATISALNEQLMTGEADDAIDVSDAAKGYLVCAPKRKPAKLMNAASAVARAKSAAKSAGRSEVFALVPVGIATRKQVLAVEFKERAA